ncbi:radical SAM/SPASM domain-containing protein [Peredibacter sp. HCB2-198]|uniref:radical SAM/SPASM domain-containing protein n=1 Tax=Peredibacter sp. HCB2-198 TaxID=3383025 RepID=UPI0038B51DA1
MRFLRTYIEISNICNLQCTFCPEVERDKKILSTEDFRSILKQILPYTEQICLHLMGEPLAHPEFPKILKICEEEGAVIHLTTNGTFLSKYGFDTFLKSKAIRQINFSLHSFKDNFPGQDMRPYLYDILQFSKEALTEKPELYINYRLWNLLQTTEMKNENQDIIDHVCEFFQVPVNERIDVGFKKSKNITGRLYFHFDSRFEWPSYKDPDQGNKGFCHALSQQIGIHADGTVVPCCLDKEAGIPLGNVLKDSFESILASERLTRMRDGFKKQLLTEELCRKCTYIKRFDKKLRPDAAPI